MNQPLAGPGLGLPVPQFLYPSELFNASVDAGTSRVALASGENLPFPAGDWFVGMGGYLVLQFKDPITGAWTAMPGAPYNRGLQFVKSDGYNVRIANLTNCLYSAVVTSTGGANYVQASTTITVTGTNATVAPIIGGALNASVASSGAGYGVAPIGIIPAPPGPASNPNGVGGIPASGYAAIASGTVPATGFTMTNPGAGYPAAPANFALLPTPTDPNLSTGITLGTISLSLISASLLMGAIVTNNGAALSSPTAITLTVGGGSGTASVSAVVMQTITAATIAGAGVAAFYPTLPAPLLTGGGVPPQGTITNNPDALYLAWFPRPANITFASVTASMPGVVYDGGLFLGTPNVALPATGGAAGTVATVSVVMGGRPDIAVFQPAP